MSAARPVDKCQDRNTRRREQAPACFGSPVARAAVIVADAPGVRHAAELLNASNPLPTEFTAGTALWTAIIVTPLGFAFGQDMSWPSLSNWGLLIAMAVSSGLIGHAMMNWSLVRIPLWVGSTFTLLIPVFSAIMAWAFLGEAVSPVQAAAMAVVIGALAIVVRSQATPAPAAAPVASATIDEHRDTAH